MIYQLAVAAVVAAVASANMYKEDPTHQKYMWESFKSQFNRSFATMDEETHRFAVFINNLKEMDKRNKEERAAGGNAVHGITKFSDMSQAEFEASLLTSDPSLKTSDRNYMTNVPAPLETTGSQDWTGKYTTPVKNQGYCGSCWAFSATEQIESDAIRTLGYSVELSPQQIVQCDVTSSGCNGGWTERAYNYVTRAGGIEKDSTYPYSSGAEGVTGKCSANKDNFVIGVESYTTIKGEENMANYVLGTGPLSICIDATTWNSYTGGIVSTCGKQINHCVQAVGVNTGSGGYWKVRNSWGEGWGESGHIRLAYGNNVCGLTDDPTYAKVFRK